MGSAKHLVLAVTGKETPARARIAEIGVLVYNVGTAHAVHLAVRYGEPLISRIVTVSGSAVARQANVPVLIGTPVADVLNFCGGLVGDPDRVLLGGPMMGLPVQNLRVPVVILAAGAAVRLSGTDHFPRLSGLSDPDPATGRVHRAGADPGYESGI